MCNQTEFGPILGNLKVSTHVENGKPIVMIHGDKNGLESFGEFLIEMSKVEYASCPGLPDGESIHTHIKPEYHLSDCSCETIISRLDRKNTDEFRSHFKSKRRDWT